MTSIFEGQPPQKRPFPVKIMVIWVLGVYYIYIFTYELLSSINLCDTLTHSSFPPKKATKSPFSSATFGDSSDPTLRRLIPCQAWVGISGRCLGLQASQGKIYGLKRFCLEKKSLVKPQTFVQSIENHFEKFGFDFLKNPSHQYSH